MEVRRVETMHRGWFVGNFIPTMYPTEDVEVAVKSYQTGEKEPRHYHKEATELTAILSGQMKFNDTLVKAGDIVKVFPGESVQFECIQEGQTVVVKVPGKLNDKYLCSLG